ncbi:MAG: ribosomal RNA small subunit methyltransferase A, partial [Thermoleophilia bacterium]|nr:ribosomal RNA small subunit methyltransferase A [Thermoleophilia bacterium]
MAQFSIEQLKRFGITPDTDLGQHFLVDDNILRICGTLSKLEETDVVWEPGPGVGVLTDFLAERVAHVHAIELDRRLAEPLEHLLAARANVSLVWGDAVD